MFSKRLITPFVFKDTGTYTFLKVTLFKKCNLLNSLNSIYRPVETGSSKKLMHVYLDMLKKAEKQWFDTRHDYFLA